MRNPSVHYPYGKVEIGKNTIIGKYTELGSPKESRFSESTQIHSKDIVKVSIGANCNIGSFVKIYEGTRIKNNVYVSDYTRIGYSCNVERGCRLEYGARICDRVKIGKNSIIANFVCDATLIGENCIVMGDLVHELSKPEKMWGVDEVAPTIKNDVVIGFNSTVVGGVTIEENSFISAGSTVTKNIPSGSVVTGTNKIIPYQQWKGKKLSRDFFDS